MDLMVNGKVHPLEVPPETPLLWVLRESMGLVGTKYGCGLGLCGACTVHLDGQAIRSCLMPVGSIGKQNVTTIEGLSPDGRHALQEAWLSQDVPQCGYCQSGQLMSAAALLTANPRPSDDEIRSAMEGNICRCGTYNRIFAAIRQAAMKLSGPKT